MGIDYEDAGVSRKAGAEAVNRISQLAESTHGQEVLGGIGSFSALFAPDFEEYEEPVLAAGVDGVGTKLKVAFMMEQHDSIGIDLVAMAVNDLICQGARPLFFLDYLSTGELQAKEAEQIVFGIKEGCQQAGCALIGGETAEMPGFYSPGEYDLAGFAVGLVDKKKIITGEKIQTGDQVLGLASNGLHSNGFSLVRKILFELNDFKLGDTFPELSRPLGEELLMPTRIYTNPLLSLIGEVPVHGLAHITGGGLIENIERIIPDGKKALLQENKWPTPPIFDLVSRQGKVAAEEMQRTFNLGIGMVVVVPEGKAKKAKKLLENEGESVYHIGEIIDGSVDDSSEKIFIEGGN